MPVAVHRAAVAAFVTARADRRGGLGLDELLQPGTDQLGEHRTRVSGLQCIELSEQGRMVKGHRAVSFGESLWYVTH
ncbi:hypothetical protein MTY66_36710 [Mycolicibacterium sp. TY66]|nr:hypothetical protein MTY66_36710 [Mycolicibacterium sp. TY66]